MADTLPPSPLRRHAPALALLLVLAPLPAQALAPPDPGAAILAPPHVELRASEPAADAALERPPSRILLHFTGAVQAGLSRVDVTDPDGRAVAVGEVTHPDAEAGDRLQASLPPDLVPGIYQVDWRTAASDGHVVEGAFVFSIGSGEVAGELRPDDPGPGPGPEARERGQEAPVETAATRDVAAPRTVPPGTGTRWLQLLGTILLLGVAASRYGVLPLVTRDDDLHDLGVRLQRGYWRAGWLALILLLLALPARLYLEFWGQGPAWSAGEIMNRLFTTPWGGGWFLLLGVVAIGGLGLVLAGQRGENPRGWAILGTAALLLPLVPALQGHVMGLEALRPMGIAAHYLHVLAVGMWLGGLILLVVVGLAAVRAEGKRRARAEDELDTEEEAGSPPLARVVNAFSRMALPAVVLFLATGATLSWLHTGGTLENYVGTTWGRTLLVKLGLVAGILALGFYNWRRVRPSLKERPDPGTLRIPASVEAVLALLVLLVTAVLVATPLPPGP